MIPLAPDIYSKSVHDHGDSAPLVVARIARNMYRTRRLALKITPRQHAKNWLRWALEHGGKERLLKTIDHAHGDAYFHISIGPTCAGLPRTKICAEVYGQGKQVFSTLELIAEIERERAQPSLL